MSGYFTRLLTRAQAKESAVRPQAHLPFNTVPFPVSAPPSVLDTASSDVVDTHQLRAAALPPKQPKAPKVHKQVSREDQPLHPASVVASLDAFAPSAQRYFDQEAPASEPVSAPSVNTGRQEWGGRKDRSSPREDLTTIPLAPDILEISTTSPVSTASADSAAKEKQGTHNGDFRLMPEIERSASNCPPLHHRMANNTVDFTNLYPAQSAVRHGLRQQPVSARAEASEVHVTIGRIEVTAVQAATPEKKRTRTEQRRPIMSLDEYLSRRQGGSV